MGERERLFGTDGVRGRANEHPMTAEMALALGQAVAHVFQRRGGDRRHRIIIGKDTRLSGYMFEADPNGIVLLMLNKDVPGVIGEVGSVLGSHGVNIAEWRLGRNEERHEALSFINLDSMPEPELVEELRALPAISKAIIVEL